MSDQPAVYQPTHYAERSESDPRRSAYVFLVLSWLVSGLGANMPFADSIIAKALLLVPPVAISLLLVLLNPRDGFAFWSFGLSLFVTQTGYQIDAGAIRFSAMELVLVVLLLILVWSRRQAAFAAVIALRMPGQTFLIVFAAYSVLMFAMGLVRGDQLPKMLSESKGFLLYPCMTYILLAGLWSRKLLRWTVLFIVAWYISVSGSGIWQYLHGEGARDWDGLVRVSAGYAPINTYGITLMAVSLLVLGIAIDSSERSTRIAGAIIAFWLFLGATVSVSRTVWVAFACGTLLLLAGNVRKRYTFGIIGLALSTFLLAPSLVTGRLLQLSDSSTVDRSFFLSSALHAWSERLLTGWGWGNAYWYLPGVGLFPTGDIPWYHNDYLNLAVQIGLIGIVLYLGYWWQVLSAAQRWLKEHAGSSFSGYVRGSQAALVALLVAAAFEHVLWRPDIAGLVGLLAGLMIASMYLGSRDQVEVEAV